MTGQPTKDYRNLAIKVKEIDADGKESYVKKNSQSFKRTGRILL
jgi:hypothetical protein